MAMTAGLQSYVTKCQCGRQLVRYVLRKCYSIEHQTEKPLHIPVMASQVINILQPIDGQRYVDMTFGAGGHTKEILSVAPEAEMIVLDRDPVAHELACNLASQYRKGQVIPLLGRFSDIPLLFSSKNIEPGSVDGIVFDLGASSMQFDQSERGFSLVRDGPLDMRMDGQRLPDQPTAADVVNMLDQEDLYEIIKKYGEEKMAQHISHAIVETRYAFGNITRTKQLADIIAGVFSSNHRKDMMMRHAHVATKTFQALRIFVNNELNELHNGLEMAFRYLRVGGKCAVLSFHSLEDRIVKRHFHGIDIDAHLNMSMRDHYRNSARVFAREEVEKLLEKRWKPMSKKVTSTTFEDRMENPRARSAKLRSAVKIL
ncbi:12S rRNA N4-methylcytidine methyltransferase-like [Gigantopelta aegis]|uniref:12S rRNA N4-methylcytidine methyltransferase-like n=1 Tax=Gigantopelta aegis TaxID=1735272 RepID=UPI001B88E3D0|nr:12S rRNA N4-methylcytidine methyltransferase-like [Gigantopelta aegis]